MHWKRTENPRVWETSDGRYHVLAEDSPLAEGSCTARVHALPLQRPLFGQVKTEVVPGSARWGGDIEAALRICVKAFDPEAVLPERESGFSILQQREKEVQSS